MKDWKQTIDAYAEANGEALFRDISRLVAVNSMEEEPAGDAPYGPGPKKALETGLAIARELGLDAVNCENYIGYASVGGSGDRYLATITHVDIVPAGNGWKADPFIMREREGYILGRGVIDDKGPSVVCLYALKFLKEQGIELKYPVRALLGANEETGMRDVEYYLAHEPAPLFCFSPDADFPLICGEKGIWHGTMKAKAAAQKILDIHGGFAPNAIPNLCEATVRAEHLESSASVDAEETEPGVWHLTAHGKAGHASMPEGTRNAIGILLDYIWKNGIAEGEEEAFVADALLVHQAYDGSALGIDAKFDGFTPLTVVSGMIGMEDGKIWQSLDSRYVPTTSAAQIVETMKRRVGNTSKIVSLRDAEPFYKSPDCPEIAACMEAYRAVTGDAKAEPFTIGGGTYARHFPNAVGFGPEYSDRVRPDFVGSMHGAEEGASKAELLESLKIYIRTLLNLEELDF